MADQQMVSVARLERMMQISVDIKKEFHYSKCSGKWIWTDRGEKPDFSGEQFETFFKALSDAVDPYEDDEEDDATSFSGEVEVLCHRIKFRYWDIPMDVTIDDDLKERLKEEAAERASACIVEQGTQSGDLCYQVVVDSDETEDDSREFEVHGWWEIAKDEA